MGKNIKKLGISLLLVICSGVGLYWYSSAEAHQESVVSAESDINNEKPINDEKEVAKDEDKIIDKSSDREDKDVQNIDVSTKDDNTLKEDENINIKKELTVEDAKELLKQYNSNVDYIYQGDETMFKEVLQDKGYKGYLFLPNVDGDIGFFVDKSNGDIYKFHPSGYMEKI